MYCSAANLIFMLNFIVSLAQAFALVQMEPSVSTFSAPNWIKEESLSPQLDGRNNEVKAIFCIKRTISQRQQIEKKLLDVSKPDSPSYGHHLSKNEVKQQFFIPSESVEIVKKYLISHGIKNFRISQLNDLVFVSMTVAEAEAVLNTKFAAFHHKIFTEARILRITKPYYLPEEVAQVVSLVDDILRFPKLREPIVRPISSPSNITVGADEAFNSCGTKCYGTTTPQVLQERYGYPTLQTSTKGNSMAVVEFQFEYFDQGSLSAFTEACGPKVSVEYTLGEENKENYCVEHRGCIEALLDIEYIGAVAHPIPLTVYYQTAYSLLEWIENILDLESPPLVHSGSYGNDEVDQISPEYMDECNVQFQLAGSRGMSILFASGDQGVWGRNGVGETFHPDFPSSSPYITSVGGTVFQYYDTIGDESVWICGGGGFSDHFPAPDWQVGVITDYLKYAQKQGVLPPESLFNISGRAYPDISALAGFTNPYCVTYRGGTDFVEVTGTSASTPVVAGMIAQLNDIKLSKGLAPLGWLNPWLYSSASSCFNDVDDKSVNYCYTKAGQPVPGFAALSGWDPATGFGTPIYSCLADLVKRGK